MWQRRSTTLQYTIYGAFFGLLFPVLSTIGDLWMQRLPLTLGNLLQVQRGSPLHWVIDTAPFFLGLFASFAGRRQDSLILLNDRLNHRVQERDQAMHQLKALQAGLEQQVADRTNDLERRNTYLEATAEVGRTASSILEAESLLRQVVELIRERFGLYYVGLFTVDERRDWAVLRAGTGEAGQAMLLRGHRIRVGEGMIGWSIANARARVALEAERDDVRLAAAELPDTRSEAALPLRSRGRVLGALTVQDTRADAFTQDAIAVLQTMADQVAVALENAVLFAKNQKAIDALQRVYGETSRKAWKDLLTTRSGLGFRRNERGISPVVFPAQDPSATLTHPDSPGTEADGRRFALPVRVRDHVLGMVEARKPQESGQWAAEEMALFEALVEQVGGALEDARLYEAARRRAQREQLVAAITDKIRAAPDMDGILRVALQEMRKALGVSHGVIHLGTDNQLSARGAESGTGPWRVAKEAERRKSEQQTNKVEPSEGGG